MRREHRKASYWPAAISRRPAGMDSTGIILPEKCRSSKLVVGGIGAQHDDGLAGGGGKVDQRRSAFTHKECIERLRVR